MADTSLNENRIGLLIWQTSSLWQSKLRQILKKFNLTLNEFLILETIYKLEFNSQNISQTDISHNSSIDTAVISVKLNFLEKKKLITRKTTDNKRTNNLILTNNGVNLIKSTINLIENEEKIIFSKLNHETFNFINSLKLLLGKKIRIKANKYE